MSQTAHMPHDVACNLLDTASQPGYVCVLSANRPEEPEKGLRVLAAIQGTPNRQQNAHTPIITCVCVCVCPALWQIIKISLSWQFTFYPSTKLCHQGFFFSPAYFKVPIQKEKQEKNRRNRKFLADTRLAVIKTGN